MAFERRIPVIPVLLDKTPLPKPEQLPPDLRLLPISTSIQIRHQSLAADVRALIERIDPPVANKATTFTQTNNGHTVNANQGSGSQIINTGDLWRAGIFVVLLATTGTLIRRWFRLRR
jgi:hypothetical protein